MEVAAETPLHVLDVLAMLPADVVAANIWHLLGSADRSHLRLTCRSSLQLFDSLICSACHAMASAADREDAAGQARDLEWWTSVFEPRLSCLSRLPSLVHLSITNWWGKAVAPCALFMFGKACQRRLTTLHVFGTRGSWWTSGDSLAITLSSPRLAALKLVDICCDDDAFQPLFRLESLTQLMIHSPRLPKHRAMASLASISGLQQLVLDGEGYSEYSLDGEGYSGVDYNGYSPLQQLSALFHLTQLTHLHLPSVMYRHMIEATAQPDVAEAAALAALGGLVRLQCFKVPGNAFHVDDAAFSALRQLTALTELMVSDILLLQAPPAEVGSLPWLQRLRLGSCSRPRDLLASLQPLLPLASLTHLSSAPSASFLSIQFDSTFGSSGDDDLLAIHQLVDVLAAIPHLTLHGLCLQRLHMLSEAHTSGMLSSLRRVSGSVRTLELYNAALRVWSVMELSEQLPWLQTLVVRNTWLNESTLTAIGSIMTRLVKLDIADLPEVCPMDRDAWLNLALVRVHPLEVACSAFRGNFDECCAIQQRLHKRVYLTLGREDADTE